MDSQRLAVRLRALIPAVAVAFAAAPAPGAGQTSDTYTDADGDTYRIVLSGPGSFTAVAAGGGPGPIDRITVAGTTPASRLEVVVAQAGGGDGRVALGAVDGPTPLRSVTAPACDLTGAGIDLPGGVGTVTVADVSDGVTVASGGGRRLPSLRFGAGTVGAGFVLRAPAQTLVFEAASAAAGGATISARAVRAFRVRAGGFAGTLRADGAIGSVSVTGGDLSGVVAAQAVGPVRVQRDGESHGGSVTRAVVAARKLGPVSVAGDVADSKVLAGAQLGSDGAPGGVGDARDTYSAGTFASLRVGGSVLRSFLGAGYSPTDATFGDLNDGIVGGARSRFGNVAIGGSLDAASRLGAGAFGAVRVAGAAVDPRTDRRFVTKRSRRGFVPPDPRKVAPAIPPGAPTSLFDAAAFLFRGRTPVQTGVAPDAIRADRISVLRGTVRDRGGAAVAGVSVTVLGRPEFGETGTRTDGGFDLAVNGGESAVVVLEKEGYLPAQRRVEAARQDFTIVGDVTLVPADAAVTAVEFGPAAPAQVHEASPQTDASGTRHAAILFPAGTSAALVMPDGAEIPVGTLHVRATEFTVGDGGPAAMPGALPATSAYTWCADLTADEAAAAGAASVRFDRPVTLFVENFLGFDVGIDVPSGFYDRARGVWEPGPSGRVVKIVSVTTGRADLDVDGDGSADAGAALAALGVTDDERTRLAAGYAAGQTLWRVPIPHFTPWDANWGFGPPADAQPPKQPAPRTDAPVVKEDDPPSVYVQSQTLGLSLPVTGTPFTLNYRSDRAPGRAAARHLSVPLSGADVPPSLKRIDLEVEVAGRTIRQSFAAAAGQTAEVEWDGLDAYGRAVEGRQPATVRIGYTYDGSYVGTTRFGYTGNGVAIGGDRTRREITLSQERRTLLGALDFRRTSVGGWSLDVHHVYDPQGRTLYLGDGTRRSADRVDGIITTVAGTGLPGFGGDGGPATSAQLRSPWGVGFDRDGALLIADRLNHRIRRVDAAGTITTFAGNGVATFAGDGGPAAAASLNEPTRAQLGPDGSIWIDDKNNVRVRRVLPGGTIVTAAGTGVPGNTGDDGPAVLARLGGDPDPFPAADGIVYVSDIVNHRIRRITTDGVISAVAGTGAPGFSGDGGPALQARFLFPVDLVPARDGSLYVSDLGNNRIRRVGTDGIVTTVAGGGGDATTEGVAALDANLLFATGVDLAPAPDGGIYFTERQRRRVRLLRTDGTIVTVAGNGTYGTSGDGGPALLAQIQNPFGLAVGPDGSLYIGDSDAHRVRRVAPPFPGFSGGDVAVPGADGTELYRFDPSGRHLATVDAFTGATIRTFGYDGAGRLVTTTDAFGETTRIDRSGAGDPVAIVAPSGRRTVLTTDANGVIDSVRDPSGAVWRFVATDGGLVTTETDPVGNVTTYAYDGLGRLTAQDAPGPASYTLTRTETGTGVRIDTADGTGPQTSYLTETLADGSEQRTNADPAGRVTSERRGASGVDALTMPEGDVFTTTRGADPRFGFAAPVTAVAKLVTPAGRTSTLLTTRSVTLAVPSDPLSLTAWTETFSRNGRVATRAWDPATRTFTVTSPAGRRDLLTLGDRGELVAEQTGGRAATVWSYDARGRLVSVAEGDGAGTRTSSIAYDKAGFVAGETDPLGRKTRFRRDAAGRPTQVALPGGGTLRLGYDAAGRVVSVTTPTRREHRFTYSPAGEPASWTAPDAGDGAAVTTYAYDAAGRMTKRTRPDGSEVSFAYDAAGRLASRTLAAGTTTYEYSGPGGLLSRVATPGGVALAFAWDGTEPLSTAWTGPVAGSVSRTIDDDLRTATQSVNGGATVSFGYDADSLLVQAGALTLTRSATTGDVTGAAIGGLAETFTTDPFGDVVSHVASFGPATVLSQQFERDALGRITRTTETIGGTTAIWDYAYDDAGRLSRAERDGALFAAYAYDGNGNRTSAGGVDATFDAQDRLTNSGTTSYAYTAAGDLASVTTGASATSFDYDAVGNLTAATLPDGTQVAYVLDGQNHRIGRRVGGALVQGFLWQSVVRIAAETDAAGSVVSRFVHAGGGPAPAYMVRGGATYRLLTDPNGSVRLVVDAATGAVAQRIDYGPFGEILSDSNPGFQPFGFAGGLLDPPTGLVRFGARDYDPRTGRWTAKDPLGFRGGDTNLYAYAGNDPVNRSDPSGLRSGGGWKPAGPVFDEDRYKRRQRLEKRQRLRDFLNRPDPSLTDAKTGKRYRFPPGGVAAISFFLNPEEYADYFLDAKD